MASINLTDEVLKHTDDEIIEFLAEKAKTVRMVARAAIDNVDPELLYTIVPEIEIMMPVLIALNRRNKERKL
jgi:hypothetical protein